LSAVSLLSGFVDSMFRDAPDPCSAGLYWFVDDDAFPISVEPDSAGQPELVITSELEAVLNRLPG
jgi:hypothetical protein